MNYKDTICALATATGGAIAVIRISGPQAIQIASSVCGDAISAALANTIHYCKIADRSSTGAEEIDQALVSVFRAPHSYTGEDSVEISCHASRYIINKVLELLVRQGCRMAEPGEFTLRAYLNGKMDLSQAEAVADLIVSTNRATHQLALAQLRGSVSTELSQLRKQLLRLTSLLELELDFSDHEELEFADRSELLALANHIDSHIVHLSQTYEAGRAMKEGIPVAIVGKTNVGKSTLLNRLLKDERAIVSSVHGTTRDTIEDTINLNGVLFRFIDTAGLRQTADEVEQIGIQRTYQSIDKAQIVLWVIDQQPTPEELADMLSRTKEKRLLVVQNKIDLQESAPSSVCGDVISASPAAPSSVCSDIIAASQSPSPVCCDASGSVCSDGIAAPIKISAREGRNINALEQAIYEAANLPSLSENDVVITSARHYEALTSAHNHLQRVIEGLNNSLSGDLLSEDLRLVIADIGDITGTQITPQETLNNIFSHFCVGK